DTEGGDNPTQIVLVEYDADDNLDNITVGRLSDMKDGLITSEKNIQKDVNEQNVQMETVAVVVKAKSSNASEKDYTTARIVYIVVRPLWYNAVNKATGGWEKHYYERSLVSNNDDYSWTKLDLSKVDLTGGKTITSIKVYDDDNNLITTVVEGYIKTDKDGNVFANLPKEGAKIEIITSAAQADGKLVVTGETPTVITINGNAAQSGDKVEDGDVVKITMGGAKYIVTVGDQTIEKDADGNTWTITVSGDEGLAVNIKVDDSKDKVLLTLKGTNLADKTKTEVWNAAGTEKLEIKEVTNIDGSYLTVEVEEGTTVQIKNSGLTAGAYYVNGKPLVIDSNKVIKLTVDENMTLDEAVDLASANAVITIHYDATALTVEGNDATEAAKIKENDTENGVIYTASGTTLKATLKDGVTASGYGIFTDDDTVKTSTNKASAADTGSLSAESWLKPVVQLTTTATDVDVKIAADDTAVTTATDFVVLGTPLKVAVKSGKGTGLIEDATKPGADVTSDNYAAKVVTLTAAVKVTLNDGITATVGGEAVTAEKNYVKASEAGSALLTCVANTEKGTTVLSLVGDAKNAAAAYDGKTSTDDIDLYMGIKITFTTTGVTTGEVCYQTKIGDVGTDQTIVASSTDGSAEGFVKSGTTLFIYGVPSKPNDITADTNQVDDLKNTGAMKDTNKVAWTCTAGIKDIDFAQDQA
ncbi:hypothetical protein D1641_16265, partial [Colidextribacter sp. OB.20]|uniref:hypothetical protein n=1 Tax=Colidextribacter sp. OB.20 TaxID=2304568 RepID=UPI0013691967